MIRQNTRTARLVLALAMALPGNIAQAADLLAGSVPVRIGNHPGFGRVVLDLPKGTAFEIVTEGERLLVVMRNAGPVQQPSTLPRNVLALSTGIDTATLQIAAGARARPTRIGDRLVLDILDPAKPNPSTKPAAPRPPALTAAARPQPSVPEPPQKTIPEPTATAPVIPVAAEPILPPPEAHGQPAPPADHAAAPPAPAPAPPPAPPPSPAPFILRADSDVAAAAFRRGALGVVVLDRRLPPQDVATLPGAALTRGVVTTMLQLPLPPDRALRLARVADGWSVTLTEITPDATAPSATAPTATAQAAATPEGVAIPLPRTGRAVAVVDPLSGGTLLIGASLVAGPDSAFPAERRTPDYTVLPTWLGVAVEPLSDRIDLRAAAKGFLLTGGAALAKAPLQNLTRRFDLPDQPTDALLNRLRAQLAGAAAAAPRARATDRMGAAQTMLALGMAVEAQALMQLATAEDPQAANDVQAVGLTAIAALLAGRLEEADGLDDPRLDGTDDVAMWRGLRDRLRGQSTPAAAALPTLAAVAAQYPETLRRLVWPTVAEAAVEAGAALPAAQLPPFAKAMLTEREGKLEAALAAYGALAAGADRLDQVRGGVRAAELRLATGAITPAQAAETIERQALAWRGDAREAGMRLRAAELHAAAGAWRPALDSLRAIEAQFPEQRDAVQTRKEMAFQSMLAARGGALSPLDVVLLAADYADCVPEGPPGAVLAALLAEKLMALDLPARAIPVLQGLIRGAPAGPARAEFGVRLAQLLLDGGDAAGAGAALMASATPDAAPALQESRTLLLARAQAGQGDVASAAAGLRALNTPAADDLLATLLAAAGDWRGSAGALATLASKTIPPEGPLPDPAQALLVRWASAAAQAADAPALRDLDRYAARMTPPRADMVRVLTAPPLTLASDLPRAARELALARTIPQRQPAPLTR